MMNLAPNQLRAAAATRRMRQSDQALREECRAMRRAFADGLSSPITLRTGFRVLVNAAGEFRAARADKPHAPGERAVVIFEPSPFAPWWIVASPAVLAPDIRRVAKDRKSVV